MATQFGNTDMAIKKPTGRGFVTTQVKQIDDGDDDSSFMDKASGALRLVGDVARTGAAGMQLWDTHKTGKNKRKNDNTEAYLKQLSLADPDDEAVWAPESLRILGGRYGLKPEEAYALANNAKGQMSKEKRTQKLFNENGPEAMPGAHLVDEQGNRIEQPGGKTTPDAQIKSEEVQGQEAQQSAYENFVEAPGENEGLFNEGPLADKTSQMIDEFMTGMTPEEIQQAQKEAIAHQEIANQVKIGQVSDAMDAYASNTTFNPNPDMQAMHNLDAETERKTARWNKGAQAASTYIRNQINNGQPINPELVKQANMEAEALDRHYDAAIAMKAAIALNVLDPAQEALINDHDLMSRLATLEMADVDPEIKKQMIADGTYEQTIADKNSLSRPAKMIIGEGIAAKSALRFQRKDVLVEQTQKQQALDDTKSYRERLAKIDEKRVVNEAQQIANVYDIGLKNHSINMSNVEIARSQEYRAMTLLGDTLKTSSVNRYGMRVSVIQGLIATEQGIAKDITGAFNTLYAKNLDNEHAQMILDFSKTRASSMAAINAKIAKSGKDPDKAAAQLQIEIDKGTKVKDMPYDLQLIYEARRANDWSDEVWKKLEAQVPGGKIDMVGPDGVTRTIDLKRGQASVFAQVTAISAQNRGHLDRLIAQQGGVLAAESPYPSMVANPLALQRFKNLLAKKYNNEIPPLSSEQIHGFLTQAYASELKGASSQEASRITQDIEAIHENYMTEQKFRAEVNQQLDILGKSNQIYGGN